MSDKLRTHEFVRAEPEYLTMSSEEIDEALHSLGRSVVDARSRMMASCYIMAPDVWYEYFTKCDGCGGNCAMFVNHGSDDETPDIIPRYKALAESFQKLGYEAEVRCYCEKCVKEFPDKLAPIVFSFRAEGMKEPVLSYPEDTEYEDYKYQQALRFLRGLKTAGTFDVLTPESMFDSERENSERRDYAENIRSIIGPAPQHNKPGYDSRPGLHERAKNNKEFPI